MPSKDSWSCTLGLYVATGVLFSMVCLATAASSDKGTYRQFNCRDGVRSWPQQRIGAQGSMDALH